MQDPPTTSTETCSFNLKNCCKKLPLRNSTHMYEDINRNFTLLLIYAVYLTH